MLTEYLERQREEVIDIMLALFDEETTMRNHDAAIERKGEKKGLKDATDLMNYLWSNNRGDEAVKASNDEGFLRKLLAEFKATTATVN